MSVGFLLFHEAVPPFRLPFRSLLTQPEILDRLKKTSVLLDEGEAFSRALTKSELFGGMEGRLVNISFYSGTSDETFRQLSRHHHRKQYKTYKKRKKDHNGRLYNRNSL